ncbi:hypothetical protein [Planosporangium mesophilum]|uniref:Uncharacterized protein n=1 Tax=Planosporangium mesophilum TaxID=689768 RepID=A0A8J3WYW7_9ACTN|nr:hypothetical protein [Planosporangium mesophilum]NJC81739.1 hypothetical protein [Planosporangium mesophilum]GII20599.1 hypothetical protein Pme01_01960 [Planosporangium mesophilum]
MDQSSHITAEISGARARPLVLVPVFALISLAGALFPSFSLGAEVLVVAVGGTLFWLGLSDRTPRRSSPDRLSARARWWLVPGLTLGVVEAINFFAGSTLEHPTLSNLADPILEGYLARAAAYFGWLTAYWGLVRR